MQPDLTQLAVFLATAWLSSAPAADFRGRWVEGNGDPVALEALDAAFESARPSARMANLPLMYKRDHLQGLSLHKQAVNPAVLKMAREAHLVP